MCFALTAYLSLDQPCLEGPLATDDQGLASWAACDHMNADYTSDSKEGIYMHLSFSPERLPLCK